MKPKSNPFLRSVSLAATILISLSASASAIIYQWTGATSSDWNTTSNWNANGVPVSGEHRININNGTIAVPANPAVFNFPGTTLTVGSNANRGLVIGSGVANGLGGLRITAGTISTAGNTTSATAADVLGNTGGIATLELDGGNFISGLSGLTMGLGGGPTSIFTLSSASSTATLTTLTLNSTSATVNLNAGTLEVNRIAGGGGTKNLNFNGGTLKARQNDTAFVNGLTAINVNGNAIIDTNGFDVSINNALRDGGAAAGLIKNGLGTLTLTGSDASYFTGPTVINAGKLTLSPAGSMVFNSNITGATDLDIGGTGSVDLGGTSTYTGATNVLTGTLNLTGSIESDVIVSSGANLGGEGATTKSIDITGTSNFFFNPGTTGTGQHLKAASVDATGAVVTFVPTGTLTNGTGIVLMEAAGGITGIIGTEFLGNSRVALSYNVGQTQLLADYTPGALIWKGNDGTNPTFWDTEVTSNWFNTNKSAADVFVAGDSVLFNDDNELETSPIVVSIQAPVFPGLVTFNNTDTEYMIGGAAIGGTGNLVKNGSGTVYLNGANTYSGTTSITAGTVVLGNAAALGANTGGTSISGTGSLDVNGYNLGTEVFTISGAGDGGAAIVNSGVQQINALGRLVLAGNATIGGINRWDLRNSAPTLDMGGFTLTKNGSNYIALVGAVVSNPGNIIVEEGTFASQLITALSGGDTHTLTIASGAFFNNYQTTGIQDWKLELKSGATFWAENGTGVQNTWSGPVVIENGGTGIFQAQGAMTVSGVISGVNSSIEKTGTSTLTLSNANTYNGLTTVTAGGIIVKNASALGTAAAGTTVATGQVAVDDGITVAGEAITINGGGTNFFGALQGNAGISAWQGNVTIGSAATRIGVNAGEFTVSGVIDSAGQPYGITFRTNSTSPTVPVSTLILSAPNTYLGDTGIVTGTGLVKLAGGANRLPTTTNLLFGISNVSGILDLNGQNQDVAGISTISGSANEIRSADPATLSVGNAAPNMFSGALTGNVSLVKSGAGSLALRGANTTAGNLTVNTGAAVELGAAVATTTQTGGVITLTENSNVIVVDSTAGLAVGQTVTATGGTGTLPGNSVITSIIDGTSFTINNLVTVPGTPASITYGALTAGKFTFHPAGNGASNKITGAGTVDLKGAFDINLTGAAIANGNEWTLVDVVTANYDATNFTITGFIEAPEGTWTKEDGGRTWTFNQSTGKLTLAAVGGYSQWATANGVTEGENGDDDKDGVINLVEYALGFNPKASSVPAGTLVGNLLTFTKGAEAKAAGDVTYAIETSTNLQSGSWIPAAATETADTISFALPANEPGGKLFGRLKVTKP
jgi:autotransporter-associated beta strand protein